KEYSGNNKYLISNLYFTNYYSALSFMASFSSNGDMSILGDSVLYTINSDDNNDNNTTIFFNEKLPKLKKDILPR
ncbi:6290_t:CDS:1, partial [Gigaspora rosea]